MKPKLRFKEFDEDWEEKKLGKVTERIHGNKLEEVNNIEVLTISASKGWLNQKERFGKVIAGKELKNYTALKRGELSYNHGNSKIAPYGTVFMQDAYDLALVPKIYHSFKMLKENSIFIQYYFETRKLDKGLRRLVSSSARMDGLLNITYDNFMTLKLNFPSLPEQEKIGQFLSLMDKRIEKQEQRIELLKERKKGWMQQLFSQTIRFKDENGQDYPAWEEKKLGEVLEEVSNKTTINNQYTLLSSTNTGLYNQLEYFKNQVASKDNIGYKILKRNQLVLSPQNLWLGNINFNNKFDIGIVSPSYKIFNIKNENLNFINYLLHTSKAFYFYKNASEQGASIVRRNLNMDLFYDISFSIPSLPEQEKIAEFLSKQDELIEKEEEKLSLLKEQKKGLLQQMFV